MKTFQVYKIATLSDGRMRLYGKNKCITVKRHSDSYSAAYPERIPYANGDPLPHEIYIHELDCSDLDKSIAF